MCHFFYFVNAATLQSQALFIIISALPGFYIHILYKMHPCLNDKPVITDQGQTLMPSSWFV